MTDQLKWKARRSLIERLMSDETSDAEADERAFIEAAERTLSEDGDLVDVRYSEETRQLGWDIAVGMGAVLDGPRHIAERTLTRAAKYFGYGVTVERYEDGRYGWASIHRLENMYIDHRLPE